MNSFGYQWVRRKVGGDSIFVSMGMVVYAPQVQVQIQKYEQAQAQVIICL